MKLKKLLWVLLEAGTPITDVKFLKSIKTYFKAFCTSNPATIAIVVGREAAQTPSFFNVFSSPAATTSGGAHCNDIYVIKICFE